MLIETHQHNDIERQGHKHLFKLAQNSRLWQKIRFPVIEIREKSISFLSYLSAVYKG